MATKSAFSIIDCDADPFVPEGWRVEKHQKGGSLAWNSSAVALYLSDSQRKGRIEGNKLRTELADKLVLNANVLDWLLANKHLISESWKKDEWGKICHIFFWATIYRASGGGLYVRCLCFGDGPWFWSYRRLDSGWSDDDPAALRASN